MPTSSFPCLFLIRIEIGKKERALSKKSGRFETVLYDTNNYLVLYFELFFTTLFKLFNLSALKLSVITHYVGEVSPTPPPLTLLLSYYF